MYKVKDWLEQIGWGEWKLEVASADASFRTYYRISKKEESYVVMDSSLLLDSLSPFVEMNERLSSVNVRVPSIIVKNMKLGYLILEDFGSVHYLDILETSNYKKLYKKAIDEIVKMQQAKSDNLPAYDEDFLLFEMELMKEWYLEKYLSKILTVDEEERLKKTLETIAYVVLSQPQDVFVHRDFHSRNIMLTPKGDVGIIDFQDARVGAITYDLVSLLKDCYIKWEREDVEKLALYYRDSVGLDVDDNVFLKWFDFMGLQRHIKVLGIFVRLSIRDGKDGYLKDLPLTLKYVLETAKRYEETQDLVSFLED